jgi:hypothetical protein
LFTGLSAWQPLKVELVAWAAHMKDVLAGPLPDSGDHRHSGLASPSRGRALPDSHGGRRSRADGQGCLSPAALLFPVLDRWPLGRIRAGALRRLSLETQLWLAMALAIASLTLIARRGPTP